MAVATFVDVSGPVLGSGFAEAEAAELEASVEPVDARFADLGSTGEADVGGLDVGVEDSAGDEPRLSEWDCDAVSDWDDDDVDEADFGEADFDEDDFDEEPAELSESESEPEDLADTDFDDGCFESNFDEEFDVVEFDFTGDFDEESAEEPVAELEDELEDSDDVELDESAQATPQPPAIAAPIPSATAKPPTLPIYAPALAICRSFRHGYSYGRQ